MPRNYLDEDANREDWRKDYMEVKVSDNPVVIRFLGIANPVGGKSHCPAAFAYFAPHHFQTDDLIR